MVKKSAKEEVQEAVEAVENATEELQEAAEALEAEAVEATQDEPKAEKPKKKNNELAIKVLGVLKTLQKNGITEVNSTTLRDKVGTKSRAPIRRAMKLLAEKGEVVISEKKLGKRKRFTYKLA